MVEADEWEELGTTVDAGGAELELLIGVAFTVEDDDEEEVATGAAELDAGVEVDAGADEAFEVEVVDEAGSGVEAPYVYVKYSVTYTTSYSVTTARSWCWCL